MDELKQRMDEDFGVLEQQVESDTRTGARAETSSSSKPSRDASGPVEVEGMSSAGPAGSSQPPGLEALSAEEIALMGFGEAKLTSGQYAEAERVFTEVIRRPSLHSVALGKALVKRASALIPQDRLSESLRDALLAEALIPGNALVHAALFICYWELQEWKEAVKSGTRAGELAPWGTAENPLCQDHLDCALENQGIQIAGGGRKNPEAHMNALQGVRTCSLESLEEMPVEEGRTEVRTMYNALILACHPDKLVTMIPSLRDENKGQLVQVMGPVTRILRDSKQVLLEYLEYLENLKYLGPEMLSPSESSPLPYPPGSHLSLAC